jgi:hypothetical protein
MVMGASDGRDGMDLKGVLDMDMENGNGSDT